MKKFFLIVITSLVVISTISMSFFYVLYKTGVVNEYFAKITRQYQIEDYTVDYEIAESTGDSGYEKIAYKQPPSLGEKGKYAQGRAILKIAPWSFFQDNKISKHLYMRYWNYLFYDFMKDNSNGNNLNEIINKIDQVNDTQNISINSSYFSTNQNDCFVHSEDIETIINETVDFGCDEEKENERAVMYLKERGIKSVADIDFFDYMRYMKYYPKVTIRSGVKEEDKLATLNAEIKAHYNKDYVTVTVVY